MWSWGWRQDQDAAVGRVRDAGPGEHSGGLASGLAVDSEERDDPRTMTGVWPEQPSTTD